MRTAELKKRVLLPLVLVLTVLVVAGVGLIGWLRHEGAREELRRSTRLASAEWDAAVTAAASRMSAAAPFLCDDRKLVDAFEARSRQKLLAAARPAFQRLRDTQGVSEIQFRDAELTPVLRVAESDRAGDTAGGVTAARARASGRPTTGLEVTRRGTLGVRSVHPWRVGGRTVGYIELAHDTNLIINRLKESAGVELIVLADKRLIAREAWQTTAHAGAAEWDHLPNEVVVARTLPELPQPIIDSTTAGRGNSADSPTTAPTTAAGAAELDFGWSDRHFHAEFVTLADAAGEPIGRLVVLKDGTAVYAAARRAAFIVAGAGLAAAVILTVLFFLLIRRLQNQVQDTQERLSYDAHHDALTGLQNRRKFVEHLDAVLRQAPSTQMPGASQGAKRGFAVLFVDCDRFKVVNDSLGHEVGDLLLQAMASRLRLALADQGAAGLSTIGRLGGDEFVVLLDPLRDTGPEATRIAEQLLAALCRPYSLKGQDVVNTVSIGITTSDGGYARAADMIRDADVAMYKAKVGGRGRIAMFDTKMREEILTRIELERDLALAVPRGELRLYYQPIISMDTGKLVGFESLVRWQHPKRGFVSPADFIPIAEETGLILPIGNWVLEEGCRQLHVWRQGYPELNLTISINLSRKQLAYPDLLERVERLLVKNAIPADALKLEITESTVMENGTSSIGVLQAIRAMGVHLWMDDFGTGYSSLSCLHRFPLNGIKIDRAFIRNVSERRDYAAVVHAIVSLAGNLGMSVVAEGVETQEQVTMLNGLDCHLGQGYLFSKPVDPKAAEQFIQKHTPLSRAA